MSRARLSTGGGWTDAEKLKVFFSLLEANGKIEYSKAYIPPGRTLKAVHHMIQKEKERMKSLSQVEPEETSTSNEDSAPQIKGGKASPASKAAKGKAGATPEKPAGKRKRAVKEEPLENGQDDPEVKKIKQEMEEVLAETEELRKQNILGGAGTYGTEA